jgi:zinc transport system substrate-binding protein
MIADVPEGAPMAGDEEEEHDHHDHGDHDHGEHEHGDGEHTH